MLTTTMIRRRPVSLALAALACVVLALGLEVAGRLPVRLPGHRALPGALALLLFAEVLGPYALLGLAVVVPGILIGTGLAPAHLFVVWLAPALLLAVGHEKAWRNAWWCFVLVGLLFGLLRFGAHPAAWHHTPDAVRLAGHLAFGAVGGLLALLAVSRYDGEPRRTS